MWEEFIEKLISEKKKVKIVMKDNQFYTGIVKEFHPCTSTPASSGCILLVDKFDEEIILDLDFIQRIVPTKDKFRGENNGG